MTNTEDQLRGSLHARAERAAYEPTAVADVAPRARVIRRRRNRTAVLAAAAAVVALAVPAIVVLGGDDARNTRRAEPGPTTDSQRYTLNVGPTNGVDEQNAGPAGAVSGILDDGRVVYADEARDDFTMLVGDLAGAPEPVNVAGWPRRPRRGARARGRRRRH